VDETRRDRIPLDRFRAALTGFSPETIKCGAA
jgi:hypothetical protein